MKKLICVKDVGFGDVLSGEKSKEVNEIFDGHRRRMVEVTLRNNGILSKHKANQPITVLCLGGS